MRVGLVSDQDWRAGIARAREAGAELICLPQLSFAPWVAASRDRAGLEHAERPVSSKLLEAVELAGGAWLSASAYESEGEGVFYATSYVCGPDGPAGRYRQRRLAAAAGRWEQMFFQPGHEGNVVVDTPLGRTATLIGSDVMDAAAWNEIRGAEFVACGVAADQELWPAVRAAVAGAAAMHRLVAVVVNREGDGFAGGAAVFGPVGGEIGEGQIVEVTR